MFFGGLLCEVMCSEEEKPSKVFDTPLIDVGMNILSEDFGLFPMIKFKTTWQSHSKTIERTPNLQICCIALRSSFTSVLMKSVYGG